MVMYPILLDIIKYTAAGIGVVYIAFYVFKPYLDRSEKLQLLELKKTGNSQTLPLRLQAYERMVLLTERINPANLLLRLNAGAYDAAELHNLVVNEIRNEYQHNVTQQIYVSAEAWALVKKIRNDTLAIVNNATKSLPADATGLDLSRTILSYLGQLENDPYELAISIIRQNLEELF